MFFFVFHTFACSPIPPMLSQRHMDLHVWAYPRPNYIFQVSSKSVQGFRSPRGSKFGLSHYFGYSLLQQLVLLYKPRLVYSTSPDSASTVIASDKSSVSTNRKSTTRFPTSHRRTVYVTPKSPKGWLKTRIFTFFVLPFTSSLQVVVNTPNLVYGLNIASPGYR